MKLRYWYKVDQNKQPIPGSNIRRKSRPGPRFQWKEIVDPCCTPLDVACTCGPRYFVQLDGRGKPVDGSLIKREHEGMPEGTDGMKFYELDWKSPCCASVEWAANIDSSIASIFSIHVNGDQIVLKTATDQGKLKIKIGDSITPGLVNTGGGQNRLLITIGGVVIFDNASNPTSTTFIWNGKPATIIATVTP